MKKIIYILFLMLLSVYIYSQETLKSIEEEYFNFLTLTGNYERSFLGYRTLSDSIYLEKADNKLNESFIDNINLPWENNFLGKIYKFFESDKQINNWFSNGFYHGIKLKFFGPDFFNSINTNIPYGQNDGALWQGKGYNSSLSSGFKFEAYGFELTLKPVITFSQNLDFYYLTGQYNNIFSYFDGPNGGSIDLVQRFGENPFFNFDFGDSEIRYTFHKFTMGFGFQSIWLGPAILNPMLASNNAGTFPKFDFGLRKTKIIIPGTNLDFGDLEFRIWIGQLTQSDYFNYYYQDYQNNYQNIFNGFNISYSPPFFRNLVIGATKVCITKWGYDFWKYLNPFYSSNDLDGIGEDQKMSIYLDLLFPTVGFELFTELGLDDYLVNWRANLFHTVIFTFGGKKAFTLNTKNKVFGEFYLEANFFEPSQDFQLQWQYTGFYSHYQITQGYTQKGQLLGAGSGYFGNSQLIGVKVYYPKGSFDLFLQRNCPNVSYIYKKAVNDIADNVNNYYSDYETYFNLGLSSEFYLLNNFILKSGIVFSYIECFRYDYFQKSNNWNFNLELKYNF